MAIRVYLTPIIGAGTKADPRRAKYFYGIIAAYSMMDYGLEPVGLVAADVTPAEHSTLIANADLSALPQALDTNPSAAAVTSTKAALEGFSIPAGWVTTAMTFREILRIVAQIFQFAQRVNGLGQTRLFPAGVTLATQFQDLPASFKQILIDAATSFQWDTSGLTGTNTMRQILKAMADQWGSSPITLLGINF